MDKHTAIIIFLIVIIAFLTFGLISESDTAYKQGYNKGYKEAYDVGYEDGYTTCLSDYGVE